MTAIRLCSPGIASGFSFSLCVQVRRRLNAAANGRRSTSIAKGNRWRQMVLQARTFLGSWRRRSRSSGPSRSCALRTLDGDPKSTRREYGRRQRPTRFAKICRSTCLYGLWLRGAARRREEGVRAALFFASFVVAVLMLPAMVMSEQVHQWACQQEEVGNRLCEVREMLGQQ